MWQNPYNRNLKWTFEDLRLYNCYAIRTKNNPLASSPPASAGQEADMREPQAHHCMAPWEWTWLLCSVLIISASKLTLQDVNQLMGIKCWLQVFQNYWFLVPISRGSNVSFPLRTPMASNNQTCRLRRVRNDRSPTMRSHVLLVQSGDSVSNTSWRKDGMTFGCSSLNSLSHRRS